MSRCLLAGFLFFSSLYCVLCYVPFTYQQFLKADVIPALTIFAHLHPLLYCVLLMLAAPAIGFRNDWLSCGFWIVHLPALPALFFFAVLARLENNVVSLIWGLAHLLSAAWIAALAIQEHYPRVRWNKAVPNQERRVFNGAWQTALFLVLTYAVVTLYQKGGETASMAVFAISVSALSHLLVLLGLFVVLNLLTVLASWFDCPPRTQFWLCHILGASLLWMVFRTLVFGALSFVGFAADLFSISFSIAASLFLASVCLARASLADSEAASGLSLAFWIAEPARCANVPFTLLKAAALAAAAFALAISVGRMDWNFLFRKLTTLLIWLIAFRLFYRADLLRRVKPSSTGWMLACALLILPGYRTYEATRNEVWKHLNRPLTAAVFLDQWCGYDLSLKLIHDALTGETGSSDFYRFLVQNTNIAHSTAVSPVDINLAGKLEPAPGKKPNIFLIVVDSLRRDYLSPYNSSVDFTPEIAKFGSESVVMENAFTHYGGTGLSEPSIWVGGMMLHKQYVTPFAPMNSLQKLLRAERYRAYVSRDTILQVILGPWPEMIELDQNRANMDYDMCASLDELSGKVAADPGDRPIFAYTQPQNIHISVINRAGAKPVSNENYGSFYAPYASRLRRMDVCFGRFIAALKSKGIYDSSVVILTADHGDSLGEQGRWGHAYTVTPEVMRIPLIVHLPPEIRQSSYIKANGLAFSTDITPSLFYLTGHPPTERGELFGRPLFTQSPEEQAGGHRDSYLVASSYAAVYGILSGNGTSLSVSDAVDYKAYGFELGSMFPSAHSLSGSAQVANEKAIHRGIMAINQLYKFGASEQARGEK